MSAKQIEMICHDRAPPATKDDIAYLLVREEASMDKEFEWGKMVAQNFYR
jgi:hypothetical protein